MATTPPDMMTSLGAAPTLAMPCTDKAADIYTLPTTLATYTSANRGDIFRCSVSEWGQCRHRQYVGQGLSVRRARSCRRASGPGASPTAHERATPPGATGRRSKATRLPSCSCPRKPLAGAPLVVVRARLGRHRQRLRGRRSFDLSTLPDPANHSTTIRSTSTRWPASATPSSWPNYSGFSYGQPPGYFSAADEAHAVLDATRAAAKLLPKGSSDKVVVVGHSQGGHAGVRRQRNRGGDPTASRGLAGRRRHLRALLGRPWRIWGAISTSYANAQHD